MAALPALPRHAGLASLAIRLVVGPVLFYHGYQKVDRGVEDFADFVSGLTVLGLGLPRFLGYVVVVLEVVGGLAILAGLLTRLWSVFLAVQFLSIPFVVKWDVGFVAPPGETTTGFEIDLLVAACVVALLLMGPGRISLDRLLGLEREPAAA